MGHPLPMKEGLQYEHDLWQKSRDQRRRDAQNVGRAGAIGTATWSEPVALLLACNVSRAGLRACSLEMSDSIPIATGRRRSGSGGQALRQGDRAARSAQGSGMLQRIVDHEPSRPGRRQRDVIGGDKKWRRGPAGAGGHPGQRARRPDAGRHTPARDAPARGHWPGSRALA